MTTHESRSRFGWRWTGTALMAGALMAAIAGAPAAAATTATVERQGKPASTAAGRPDCTPTIAANINVPLTERFGNYGDTSGRWTGADSAYSVPLGDGRIAWIYSDTFMGTVDPDGSRPLDSLFLHNSIIVDDHGVLTTHTGGTAEAPGSLVTVEGGNEHDTWYWFGDATLEGRTLQVMLLEFKRTGSGVFDFAFVRTAIASLSTDDFSLQAVTALPAGNVNWGSAIVEEGDYTYVYGVEDRQAHKYAHLARVPSGSLTTAPWEYLSDAGWVADPAASKRILEGVSNEFSVQKFQGRYTLVTGDATEILSSKIVMYRSSSLEGPFESKTVLYQTPETGGNVFTYNAKAHPELGNGNTLVVTYNVNSFDTRDVYTDVDNYRPRYVDVSAKVPNCTTAP